MNNLDGYEWPEGYEQYDAKRWWYDPPWKLYQWPPSKPVFFSGDEFARRTLVLCLPLPAANLAVAHRSCNARKWIHARNEQLRVVG